jgi:hypothetical protein
MVIIAGGGFYLYSKQKVVLGAIYILTTISAAIVFGVRWFLPNGELNQPTITKWPPIINTCPDFLTLYYKTDKTPVCIDTNGISKVPTGINKAPTPMVEEGKYMFNLYINEPGSDRPKKICEECASKGVTWEGVFDGATCMNVDPPKPAAAK